MPTAAVLTRRVQTGELARILLIEHIVFGAWVVFESAALCEHVGCGMIDRAMASDVAPPNIAVMRGDAD